MSRKYGEKESESHTQNFVLKLAVDGRIDQVQSSLSGTRFEDINCTQ
jgi:hypothetical protein